MLWDEYYIQLAETVSLKSKDPSTKVGAVIVGPDKEIRTTGYNGFPRGVNETLPERWEKPEKYTWIEHAERNAILNAARIGVSTKGCVMYLNWEPIPCVECTKAVIQSGIVGIVGPNKSFPSRAWNFDTSREMLKEAGVFMRVLSV